ncbi:MAG: hypothetical protein II909_02545 [Kiritimatiellae bacterium]|nr:hypothetical protein [Kiritimatiellia bacterium]
MAKADVTSEIVGYQAVTIKAGAYQLYTVTFQNIDDAVVDLTTIVPKAANGSTYTGNNKIRINKLASNGNYLTTYNYRTSKGGWCKSATAIEEGDVTMADGEGIAVYNGESSDIQLMFSGRVNLNPMSEAVAPGSYSIVGNMTPVSVDLTEIVPCDAEGVALASSNNKIRINQLEDNGNYGTTYNYRTSKGGWCKGATAISAGTVVLAAGEAMAVYNGDSIAVKLQLPPPVAE